MPHGIWKGEVNFGLVTILVTLQSAETHQKIKLRLLDKRNLAPIRYARMNSKTGKEVPWDQIVEGYEYKPDRYVILNKTEVKDIFHYASHSIDIVEFTEEKAIDTTLFDKPYYLEPNKRSLRSYILLREALQKTGKVGIAKVVIHTQQHLAILTPRDNILVLEILRFPDELRKTNVFDVPEHAKISTKEVKMAEHVIDSMTAHWNPKKYHNDYQQHFLKYVKNKVRKGKIKTLPESEKPKKTAASKKAPVDLLSLLKKSVHKKRP